MHAANLVVFLCFEWNVIRPGVKANDEVKFDTYFTCLITIVGNRNTEFAKIELAFINSDF